MGLGLGPRYPQVDATHPKVAVIGKVLVPLAAGLRHRARNLNRPLATLGVT